MKSKPQKHPVAVPKIEGYRDYYAVMMLSLWPENGGPAYVSTDGTRNYSVGFMPLFETKAEADKVAENFPNAIVMAIPMMGVVPDVTPKKNPK